MLVPLQVAAITKARAASRAAGGILGSVIAVAGVSCCRPLLLPAILSFVGFSGTALLGFNLALRGWWRTDHRESGADGRLHRARVANDQFGVQGSRSARRGAVIGRAVVRHPLSLMRHSSLHGMI